MFESSTATRLQFTIHTVNMQIVNSVRRTILSEVENGLSPQDVRVTKTRPHNTTSQQRVAMVPPLALAEVTAYVPGSDRHLAVKNAKRCRWTTTADMELKLHGVTYPHRASAVPSRATTSPHALAARPGDCT
jgi:hypothetical protein